MGQQETVTHEEKGGFLCWDSLIVASDISGRCEQHCDLLGVAGEYPKSKPDIMGMRTSGCLVILCSSMMIPGKRSVPVSFPVPPARSLSPARTDRTQKQRQEPGPSLASSLNDSEKLRRGSLRHKATCSAHYCSISCRSSRQR